MIDTTPRVAPERILISKLSVDELVKLNDEALTSASTYGLYEALGKLKHLPRRTTVQTTKLRVVENALIARGELRPSQATVHV